MTKLLVILVVIVGIIAGMLWMANKTKTGVTQTGNSQGIQIQAWIYPGEPTCSVNAEIADGRNIDVLKPEYFELSDAGGLKLLDENSAGCNGYSPKNVELVKQYSHLQFVTVSGHYKNMVTFFQSGGQSEEAVTTLTKFVGDNGLTGVEVDFEDFSSWKSEDYQKYIDWVTKLGKSLRASGKQLIVDGPAMANPEQQGWYKWKYEDMEKLPVDYMVVMPYDYQTDQGVGNAIAPDAWVKDSVNWVITRISNKDRVVVGLPAYGYIGKKGTYLSASKTLEQMQQVPGFGTAQRDSGSGELIWSDDQNFYVVVDQAALEHKLKLVNDLGVKRVSVWHLGGNAWFSR